MNTIQNLITLLHKIEIQILLVCFVYLSSIYNRVVELKLNNFHIQIS